MQNNFIPKICFYSPRFTVLKNYSNHAIFLDNFFSLTALCRDLARKGIKCTGTILQNRTQN